MHEEIASNNNTVITNNSNNSINCFTLSILPSTLQVENYKMPFWSRGNADEASTSRDFTSSDETSSFSSGASSMPSSSSSLGASAGGAGGGSSVAEMQQFVAAVQQQVIIQESINALTDEAFKKCITKPAESLSGREAACIQAVSLKWLDTNKFMAVRMQKKMSAGQQAAM